MAIDYSIDFRCEPKRVIGTRGIIDRIKMRERAKIVVQQYREQGDNRPLSEMGFEFSHSTPDGESELVTVIVQEAFDDGEELDKLGRHCHGCPANRTGQPFGCIGYISYPISAAGEAWLLNQLPVPDDALVWLLLKQGVENFMYDGQLIARLRSASDAYFEDQRAASRLLGEFDINANQVFEMFFNVGGEINPNHAGVLLLFFHAIPRDVEAGDIMHLTPAPPDADERYPFILQPDRWDDPTTLEFKALLEALYLAWRLNVNLKVDA